MSKDINEGDEVYVQWTGISTLVGVVQHRPQDVGDLWYIKDNKTGAIHAINPNCSLLERITRHQR